MCPAENPTSDVEAMRAPVILVVEDEVLIRLSIAEHLRDTGFVAIEASSAEEARSVLEGGVGIDLVFSDVHMENGDDGFALASWIAQHFPHVQVMLTSGVTSSTEAAKLQPSTPFLNKPYDAKWVEGRIRKLLADKKA